MKNIVLKNIVATSLLLTTNAVFAHSQTGSLGKAAVATDLYQVTCEDDGNGAGSTSFLKTSVKTGIAPAGLKVSVRVQRLARATNTTDVINGDSLGSPFVKTLGGDGVYYMTVGKTAASNVPISYSLEFHCESSTGGHTGTSWIPLQNQ